MQDCESGHRIRQSSRRDQDVFATVQCQAKVHEMMPAEERDKSLRIDGEMTRLAVLTNDHTVDVPHLLIQAFHHLVLVINESLVDEHGLPYITNEAFSFIVPSTSLRIELNSGQKPELREKGAGANVRGGPFGDFLNQLGCNSRQKMVQSVVASLQLI